MQTKIVVLDARTTSPLAVGESDPAHPSWDGLAALGELRLFGRTRPEEVLERAAGAPVVLTNKVVLDRGRIEGLPELRYIGLMSTGTNAVDLEAARERGIAVTNVPAYSTASVAQHTIALLLELATRLSAHAGLFQSGAWAAQPDFSVTAGPITELAGKTFGLVGCGEIARATGRIAHALGMRVLVHSRTRRSTDFPCGWADRDRLLAEADVISLHCPLTEETRHWIDAEALARVKPGAILLNTGRGPLVDEPAVAAALRSGRLGGYGADVTDTEPPPPDHPLRGIPGAVVTPHVAWASREARGRLMRTLVSNLEAFLAGKSANRI
ncbi:MAG: D-2-hydroxyacid dehydrogenase [Puniceicoccaceae bacterium]